MALERPSTCHQGDWTVRTLAGYRLQLPVAESFPYTVDFKKARDHVLVRASTRGGDCINPAIPNPPVAPGQTLGRAGIYLQRWEVGWGATRAWTPPARQPPPFERFPGDLTDLRTARRTIRIERVKRPSRMAWWEADTGSTWTGYCWLIGVEVMYRPGVARQGTKLSVGSAFLTWEDFDTGGLVIDQIQPRNFGISPAELSRDRLIEAPVQTCTRPRRKGGTESSSLEHYPVCQWMLQKHPGELDSLSCAAIKHDNKAFGYSPSPCLHQIGELATEQTSQLNDTSPRNSMVCSRKMNISTSALS
ncbi:hypothetical protein JHW43_006169 [Diplocarpon mali]|nr:hypothetical protein JHW43_006169 [Diplocarpon mali]